MSTTTFLRETVLSCSSRTTKPFGLALCIPTLCLAGVLPVSAASYYTQRLEDPKAAYVDAPGGGDDTVLLQQAVNRVHETIGQGIVFLAQGRYRISDTLYIWPAIRLIGFGAVRPVIVLPARTPGFDSSSREKVMIFFAGARPGFDRDRRRIPGAPTTPVPDASPGTLHLYCKDLFSWSPLFRHR